MLRCTIPYNEHWIIQFFFFKKSSICQLRRLQLNGGYVMKAS